MEDAMEVEGKPAEPAALRTCLQEHDQNHQCTRFCVYHHVFGNLYYCETSRQSHVCDSNCSNKIYYDSSTTICRLSKKLFNNDPKAVSDRKRGTHEDRPELVHGKRGRQ